MESRLSQWLLKKFYAIFGRPKNAIELCAKELSAFSERMRKEREFSDKKERDSRG